MKDEENQKVPVEFLKEGGGNDGDLPVTAAVFCRPGRQDDGAGHQHLQQDHQDEVEVDLKAGSCKESGDVLHLETDSENKMTRRQREKTVCYINSRWVQDEFASEPNQAGGCDGKRRHVDHLEVRHLDNKKLSSSVRSFKLRKHIAFTWNFFSVFLSDIFSVILFSDKYFFLFF